MTLSGLFVVIGVMVAMGPGGSASPDDGPTPLPDPGISTKAPASVTVTR